MTTDTMAWPVKTGDFVNAMMDSTRWNDFPFRADDIVVATYAKCGTTLTQQIVSQLVFDADPTIFGGNLSVSPWIDLRAPPMSMLEVAAAQTHRRILKTHLPLWSLVYSPTAKYITVGRDARDIAWSFHNHARGFTDAANAMRAQNGDARAVDDADPDVRVFYHRFLEHGIQDQPFWPQIQGWWNARRLPNLLTLHFADLIADLPGQIRRVAAFLEIPLDEARLPAMVEHCGLAHMRRLATEQRLFDTIFKEGAKTFINKGTNGRWRDVLSQAEIDKCDEIAARELTPDCAAWLRDGTTDVR